MKQYKMFLLGMLIIPWFSLPLLGKKTVKRFFLSSLIINILAVVESFFAHRYQWWWFYKRLHPKLLGDIPLIFGPFLVGSMWIFKFTYGRFFTYIKTNFLIDTFFIYIVMSWFKKIGYGSIIRLRKYQFSLLFIAKSLVLYGTQLLIDNISGKRNQSQGKIS
ncbi:hypothetical protein [Oceanobacillus salinisoli]|uniref:hypothetical protein n=1 Tax=Oceanobacillus salinisoli TaxID=2678611 RepID=UPI0012E2AA7C|nr:hypothetical protein [Oceanobacillus salinisoli]